MNIRQFIKRKSISDKQGVTNNSGKRFENWVLFNQHRLKREPQTYLLIVQVHFRLRCVNMRQFSKLCNGRQKVHLCGKFVYSSTWKRFRNTNGVSALSADVFPVGATSKFCLSFSGCWQCKPRNFAYAFQVVDSAVKMDVHKMFCPF